MDNSTLFARFIGPYIMVIGIGLLFNLKVFLRIMEDFFKNSALVYITGLITFVAGLAIISFHNVWGMDWPVIITLFGWSALIKGVWLVVFPASSAKVSEVFVKNIKLAVIPWIIMLALGIFLTIKGYSSGICPVS